MKKANPKRLHTMWFHFYILEMENRLLVARLKTGGGKEVEWGRMLKRRSSVVIKGQEEGSRGDQIIQYLDHGGGYTNLNMIKVKRIHTHTNETRGNLKTSRLNQCQCPGDNTALYVYKMLPLGKIR